MNRKNALFLFLLSGFLAAVRSGVPADSEPIDLAAIKSPIIFRGDAKVAYRDPAVLYHDGTFHLYFTYCRMEKKGAFWFLGYSHSRNLTDWSKPELLTPHDRDFNFSSPGNVVRVGDEWILCLQTYPTPLNQTFGTQESRIWIMRSRDLRNWGDPELLRVKGPDVPPKKMGRMIDPYLVRDKDDPDRWWCFYKQNGVSLSWSNDLKTWHYAGRHPAGENVCVLVEDDEYVLMHSPRNGLGIKRSRDLKNWRDWGELITLGQDEWPWAQGRLTAGAVVDLRADPRVGKYLLFFHGSSRAGLEMHRAHGHGTLGLAWSDDLITWHWPGKEK